MARRSRWGDTHQLRNRPKQFFHEGSAQDPLAVANHYDQLFVLNLTAAQKADPVEFLKSL